MLKAKTQILEKSSRAAEKLPFFLLVFRPGNSRHLRGQERNKNELLCRDYSAPRFGINFITFGQILAKYSPTMVFFMLYGQLSLK